MLSKIDVIYQNGEVVDFYNPAHRAGEKVLDLVRNLQCDLEFRFCNADGAAETVLADENFGRAQALLTCRDRVLTVVEKNISFYRDEMGFQVLKIADLVLDSAELRQVLSDSYLELEPHRRGVVDCEFSAALSANAAEQQAMQLFFTLGCTVKDPVIK